MRLRDLAIPDELSEFVTTETIRGGFESANDYITHLVKLAQQLADGESQLQAKLIEGIDSGSPVAIDDAFWAERRARLDRHRSA